MKFTLKRPIDPGFYWINDEGELTIVQIYYPFREKKDPENLVMTLLGNGCVISLQAVDYFLWGDKIEVPEI